MTLPTQVRIVEVGPRDGLQNEPTPVPVATRVALIQALQHAGLREIEVGSFVSPRAVPQMADTDAVLRAVLGGGKKGQGLRPWTPLGAAPPDPHSEETRTAATSPAKSECGSGGAAPSRGFGGETPDLPFPAQDRMRTTVLVPNLRGYGDARACGARDVAVFASASESFSQANINCSIAQSLERFAPVMAAAAADRVRVRGYVSCALGCPFEGAVAPEAVAAVARDLLALGCEEVSLGDTIGVGTPRQTQRMIEVVAAMVPVARLALHCHDTYGQALANILAAMERGVAAFDSAVAGLGGCPYAPGATGNVASEDLVYMLDGMDIATGIDLTRLRAAGRLIGAALHRRSGSRAARALDAREARG